MLLTILQDSYYFNSISNSLDLYNQHYDKFLLIGDFNSEDTEQHLSQFLYEHGSKNLVKAKTCFKNPENPSCIDLFITNSPHSFNHTTALSTGLSDCHDMTITVLKSSFTKAKPKEILYRNYKKLNSDNFKLELKNALDSKNATNYELFESIFLEILNNYAPLKRKFVRANHAPYMTKPLRKAIMKRSELQSKYHKKTTEENKTRYKKQKNFCSKLYKREKKRYYNNLNLNDITTVALKGHPVYLKKNYSTLVQSSIRRSCNRQFDTCNRRFDARTIKINRIKVVYVERSSYCKYATSSFLLFVLYFEFYEINSQHISTHHPAPFLR